MNDKMEAYKITVCNGQGQATFNNCHRPRIKKDVVSFWRETELGGLIEVYEFYIGNPGCSVQIEKVYIDNESEDK